MACLAVTSAISALTRSQSFASSVLPRHRPSSVIWHHQAIVNAVPNGFEWLVRLVSYFSFMDHFFRMTKASSSCVTCSPSSPSSLAALLVTDLGLRSKRAWPSSSLISYPSPFIQP